MKMLVHTRFESLINSENMADKLLLHRRAVGVVSTASDLRLEEIAEQKYAERGQRSSWGDRVRSEVWWNSCIPRIWYGTVTPSTFRE